MCLRYTLWLFGSWRTIYPGNLRTKSLLNMFLQYTWLWFFEGLHFEPRDWVCVFIFSISLH
jgi:hypothetical protein